jgi:hypothetical protein
MLRARASGVLSYHGAPRVGNDGLQQVSQGVRCNSTLGGNGMVDQRSFRRLSEGSAQQ